MKKCVVYLAALALAATVLVPATPALAVHPEEKGDIENLKQRLETLEAQQNGAAPAGGHISDYVTLHGLLEAEASYLNPADSAEESDLTLATAELAIEATLNASVGGHLILLYEDGAALDVDEAVLSLTAPQERFGQTLSLHVGRMYVPFGMFNSYLVSDPLTLELGETQNSTALFVASGDLWALKAGVFNGETDAVDDNNHIDSVVAAVEVTPSDNLAVGVSYLSDLAESSSALVGDPTLYDSDVAAVAAFLSARCQQFGLEVEYLTALEDFDAALVALGGDLTGERPQAWNLELAWTPTEQLQVAARYEQAEDYRDDVKRYGAVVAYGLYDHAVVALEYLRADSDAAVDDRADLVTAQLALEF